MVKEVVVTAKYAIGIDYGTNSVRALVVNAATGEEIGTNVCAYPSGDEGIITDAADHNLARQSPEDWLYGLERSVKAALAEAGRTSGFRSEDVIGIGVDTTGSTPLPVDRSLVPLASSPRFAGNPNALAWLWKDHTAAREAAEITEAAKKLRPQYLAKCGGTYSSEWFFSKVWHCLRTDPDESALTEVDRLALSAALPALTYVERRDEGSSRATIVKRSSLAPVAITMLLSILVAEGLLGRRRR